MTFLSATTIADIAGLTNRAVERALRRALVGTHPTWHGARLAVRERPGRGGRSGLLLEARLDSLPIGIQEAQKAFSAAFEGRLSHGEKAQSERDWWYGLLSPALAFEKHSPSRGAVVRDIASRRHMRPDGTWATLTERTIHRKLAQYESGRAIAALARPKRADAGRRRTTVSLAFDKAVAGQLDPSKVERIAHELRQHVRSLIKSGESPGYVSLQANLRLRELAKDAGFDPGEAVCRVPAAFISAEKVFAKVHRFKTDRKAYEDRKPRIPRSRSGLQPMDVLVGDVTPLDVAFRRHDGSIAYPRCIAWLDLATNRIWIDVVLLEKGEGIRNADVIASFVRMLEKWGAPRALLLDNGSEYNFAAFMDDALKLIDSQGRRLIDRIEPWAERDSNIVRAQPYNAAAKPIEGIFSVLTRTAFPALPGFSGGERMKKKTANVGHEPVPFPGTIDDLRSAVAAAVSLYHLKPQRGTMRGLSPQQAYAKELEAGWGRTAVNPDAMRIAFSTEETRVVHQGAIRQGNRRWTCRELQAYHGDRVTVRIPKYEDWQRLPVYDDAGELLGFAEADVPYGFLDPAGAVETRERQRVHRQSLRALDRSAPDIDVLAERAAFVQAAGPGPEAAVIATIAPSDKARQVLDGFSETSSQRRNRQQDEWEREVTERLALIEGNKANGQA